MVKKKTTVTGEIIKNAMQQLAPHPELSPELQHELQLERRCYVRTRIFLDPRFRMNATSKTEYRENHELREETSINIAKIIHNEGFRQDREVVDRILDEVAQKHQQELALQDRRQFMGLGLSMLGIGAVGLATRGCNRNPPKDGQSR